MLAAVAVGRDKLGETREVLAALEAGSLAPTQAANRIAFLGTEAPATEVLALTLRQLIDARRRAACFEVLAQIATPNPELLQPATAAAASANDITLRLNAIRVLGRLKQSSAAKPLEPLLKDPSLGVRREVARAFVALKAVNSSGALLEAAKVEDDPEVRAAMLVAVGRLGDAKRAAGVEPFLASSSETTRLAATQALCLLGNKKGLEAAKKLLGAADTFTRVQGVLLFEGAALKAASPLLTPLLTDSEASVRAKAARVLAQAGDATRVEWLVVESFKAPIDQRLVYETELELLRLADDQRAAILKKAGLSR